MIDTPKIVCVVGTRPEAIKVAPLVLELRKHSEWDTVLVSTGQHREMLSQALGAFGLTPDHDLDIMQHGQTLADVTSRCLSGITGLIDEIAPKMILGQGDTTTVFAAAVASFYRHVPFGHVEAGLRTPSVDNPFPEEFNRRAAGLVASLHFAPTVWAAENLLKEGKDPKTVFTTGNTGVDAVLTMATLAPEDVYAEHKGRVVVLTTHRRENWGEPMRQIAEAALEIVNKGPDILLIAPMHRNPVVREVLTGILGGHDRIRLVEPPDYRDFVALMRRSDLILSDSGGVQEEAPAFGKPVLVLRDETERPEGVTAGTAKLVGTHKETIMREALELLTNPAAYEKMAKAVSPYGDGQACGRIAAILKSYLGVGA